MLRHRKQEHVTVRDAHERLAKRERKAMVCRVGTLIHLGLAIISFWLFAGGAGTYAAVAGLCATVFVVVWGIAAFSYSQAPLGDLAASSRFNWPKKERRPLDFATMDTAERLRTGHLDPNAPEGLRVRPLPPGHFLLPRGVLADRQS